jgi:hypothetical protein
MHDSSAASNPNQTFISGKSCILPADADQIPGACNIIRVPIKQAASVLRFRETVSQNVQVTPDPTLAPRFQWSHPLLKRTDLNPDWVVSDRSIQKTYYSAGTTDGEQDFVFAVGDSKLSQKWKSDWIQRKYAARHVDKNPAKTAKGRQHSKTHNVTAERLLPLGQLSTYCRFGETRYGFLLTQEELVAFRVRRIDGSLLPGFAGTKPCIAMEYKSVPWAESGPGKLTVDLAIWALGCMGMNDNHRIMETGNREPLESMVRLTKWTHDKAKKVYRNVISGREIPENTWKDMGKQVAFVKLDDDKDGLSYTSSFTQTNFGQGGGVAAITQGVGAVNLNTSSQDNRSQGNNGPAGADAQKAKSRGVASQQTKSPAASGHQTKSPAASGHQTKSPAAASGHQTKSPAAASGHQTKSPAAASSQRAKPSDRREADTPSKRSR